MSATVRPNCANHPACPNVVELPSDTVCLECNAHEEHGYEGYYSGRLKVFQRDAKSHRMMRCEKCGVQDDNLFLSLNHCRNCGY